MFVNIRLEKVTCLWSLPEHTRSSGLNFGMLRDWLVRELFPEEVDYVRLLANLSLKVLV